MGVIDNITSRKIVLNRKMSNLRATLYFDPSFSNSPITQSVIQGVPI